MKRKRERHRELEKKKEKERERKYDEEEKVLNSIFFFSDVKRGGEESIV